MHPSPKSCADTDLRSLLKHQHKTVYSICRLFARTYKEHQHLFTTIIAAASQNIRTRKEAGQKQTMLWRACINMAALHSIAAAADNSGEMQFKSPDYQRSMTALGNAVGRVSDYEKFLLFMEFEHIPQAELGSLIGRAAMPGRQPAKTEIETPRKEIIPSIKDKIIWS